MNQAASGKFTMRCEGDSEEYYAAMPYVTDTAKR